MYVGDEEIPVNWKVKRRIGGLCPIELCWEGSLIDEATPFSLNKFCLDFRNIMKTGRRSYEVL